MSSTIAMYRPSVRAGALAHDFRVRPDTREARDRFARVKRAEGAYARMLRQIARSVGSIVTGIGPDDLGLVEAALRQYADLIAPWARAAAGRMLADVARRDAVAWNDMARSMARALRVEIATAPTGAVMQTLMAEQVDLITSIPREAAERVHQLAIEALSNGSRAKEIAAEIMRSGEVAKSRANLIAFTETGRAATTLLQARALSVGSDGYIWRTARDTSVRPSHRAMEGKFVRWTEPPTLDNLSGHAGALPRCRCYPEPQIPDEF